MTGTGAAGDRGETLVELLVSMSILGIVVATLLGGLQVSGRSSVQHRKQVQVQTFLRAWAEQTSAAAYTPCATAAGVPAPNPALPAGFTATVVSMRYWSGTTFATTCAEDRGIQKVGLRVSAANQPFPAVTQTLDVVVRRPCTTTC